MLTRDELISLSHLLQGERVLSVYIDGAPQDPAQQRVWRVTLDHALRSLRRSLLEAPHAERMAFEECVTRLGDQIGSTGSVGGPGWCAFITSEAMHHAGPLPAPTPTLAVWEPGIHVTPYMRALEQHRPVVVAITDARKTRLWQYVAGALTHNEMLQARVVTEPPSHMGNPPVPGFHGGTRGATGESAEQRMVAAATERLVADAAARVTALAGADGWIVVGGIPRVAAQLARKLERTAEGRVLERESLDVHASDAEVAAAARAGASALRDATDLDAVTEIVGIAERTGAAALGPEATRYALEQSCVRALYVTERFTREHAATAEEAVRAALGQGAAVDVLVRDVAARLDQHGGIAARLRYAPTPRGASMSIQTSVRSDAVAEGAPT